MSLESAVKEVLQRLMDDIHPPKLGETVKAVALEMNVNEAALFQKVVAAQDKEKAAIEQMRMMTNKLDQAKKPRKQWLPYKD